MYLRALDLYVCPKCGGPLEPAEAPRTNSRNGEIEEGRLVCEKCAGSFPVVRGIPRFVPSESYASSFGFQWNRFGRIQIDKIMHNNLSRDRFNDTTEWPSRLEGERILEAGCGAGRFTQLALETGAEIFSFDLSNAVDACYQNQDESPRLNVFQASIYEIPLRKESFDKIFCLGVLQHCPDVKRAFFSLIPYLKPEGEIVIDVYAMHRGIPPLKYWVRPFVKHLQPQTLHRLLSWTIPPAFELKKALHKIPAIGAGLGRLVPIGPVSHKPRLNYTDEELKQVKILSAFDMLSPTYDQPQKMEEVQQWFKEAGLVEVKTKYGYNGINAKGRKQPQEVRPPQHGASPRVDST
ncbi:MAG: methyltransferase domain-containing protein [Candidatus Acidiferrales bacterium]